MIVFSENEAAREVQERLLSQIGDLSMLPEVASEALAISKDPECQTDELVCVVKRDLKLATDVLRLANSPIFAGKNSILNLNQAIVRLGLRQCRNLILTSSIASMMKNLPLEQEWVREVLWHHSIVTANTCVHLNRSLKLGFDGDEFTAGLLHDLGRLLLAVTEPDKFVQADNLSFDETTSPMEQERLVIGIDHCELGAWYAKSEGIPESLVHVIANHHRIEEATEFKEPLVALVATADHMANHIQKSDEIASYDPHQNPWIDLLGQQFQAPLKDRFVEVSSAILEAVLDDSDISCQSRKSVTGGTA